MSERRNWTRDELLLAINLYCKTQFGRIHNQNADIIHLAKKINRTPSAVSYKLANFASLDTSLSRKGASNVSKLDKEIWNEFFMDGEAIASKSEQLLDQVKKQCNVENSEYQSSSTETEITREVKSRVTQSFFRNMILALFDYRCCVTGLSINELLIASHIIPWSMDENHRMNPQNGLCLNAIHDKAFDRGLMCLSNDYKIIISSIVKKRQLSTFEEDLLLKYEGNNISLPHRFLPNPSFLEGSAKAEICL